MDETYWKIHSILTNITRYDLHAKEAISKKDYPVICNDADNLLVSLEEGNILDRKKLGEKYEDFSHFIGSLKTLKAQRDSLDKDVIESAYHESRKHASPFLKILFSEMHIHL